MHQSHLFTPEQMVVSAGGKKRGIKQFMVIINSQIQSRVINGAYAMELLTIYPSDVALEGEKELLGKKTVGILRKSKVLIIFTYI